MSKIWANMIHNIKREKMISVTNIMVMTVTFVLLGTFLSVIVGSQTALKYLEQQAQITVFFKDDFGEANITNYKAELEKDSRISSVKYVSKEDAYKIFSEVNKNEPLLLESVSPSILPASLEIKAVDLKDLSVLSEEFSKKDGVEEVKFFRDVIEKFRSYTGVVYITGAVLVFLFFIISYTVIIVNLRTTINSKSVELEILKLVGASNNYVTKPLVLQGVLFGFVSSVLASLLVVGTLLGFIFIPNDLLYMGLYLFLGPAFIVNPYGFSAILSAVLITSGLLLGYIGSTTAVKKYLKY